MNRNEIKLTCIGCPLGCMIDVALENNEVVSITGNTCKRGYEYAKSEVTAPTRIVTSTVKAEGGIRPVVAVKTSCPIPKGHISDCMAAINGIIVKAPVKIGDVLLKGVAGNDADIVATANLKAL